MPLEEIIVGREPSNVQKFGSKGCVFLGKHTVSVGFETNLTNPILMDVAEPHVMLIVGKRGSGKSYSAAVIAEEIMQQPVEIRNQLSVIMIDTAGIFWSMKEPNDQALLLLKQWKVEPKSFDTKNIIPLGLTAFYKKNKIDFDDTFAIKPSDLTAGDWALTFSISLLDPLGVLLERAIKKLEGKGFSLEDIMHAIEKDDKSDVKERQALTNRFSAAEGWGIFSKEATPIEKFLVPGIATVLDVSLQEWNVRNLMLAILARKLYEARTAARREEEMAFMEGESKRKVPLIWLIMDEAHNFVPSDSDTAATNALLTLVRQGRQPGISTVFITQRPNRLHEDVIAQADFVLAHRITAKQDLEALGAVMQTYLLEDIQKLIAQMPKTKGAGIILDDNSERLFAIQVRPRQSWHAGGTASALK